MPIEHRSTLSQHQQAPDFPGGGYLFLARLLIFVERHWRLCWRFYTILSLFLALAWSGLTAALPPFPHFILLVFFVAAALYVLAGTGEAWFWPGWNAAARRLERDSDIPHRPYETLVSQPASGGNDPAIRALWRKHQDRARAALKQIRMPRPHGQAVRDPWRLRFVLPALALAAALAGRGELKPRLIQALTLPAPQARAFPGGDAAVNGWITPPAYTRLPPIMLTPGGDRREALQVPAGSALALRVNRGEGAADSDVVPRLRADGAVLNFVMAGGGGFRFDGAVPPARELMVMLGWAVLGRWRIDYVEDRPPTIVWRNPPKVEKQDVMLDYEGHDDYGAASVTATMTLAISAPGLPNKPVVLPLPGVGLKDIDGREPLDLTASSWSGMPVMLHLEITDQKGQKASSEAMSVTLPQRKFTHPTAILLAEARRRLLTDPQGQWQKTANIAANIAARSSMYRADPAVFLALRSTAVRMLLDRAHRQSLPVVAETLWRTALRLDAGNLPAAQDQLRAAQRKLEEALAGQVDPETLRRLTEDLQQALAQYMNEMAQNAAQEHGDIPQELLQDEDGQNLADELMRRAQEIQDLAATGSREAAKQKLQELQQMLRDLAQAKPMSEAQQAELQAYGDLKKIIDAQQQLQDDTSRAAQSTPQGDSGLQGRQDELRTQLGDLTENMASRGADLPDGLAKADQHMKGASQALRARDLPEAGDKQGQALQALKDLAQNMKQNMKFRVLRVSPAGQGQRRAGRPDPFADPGPTDRFEDDGSVHVPEKQKIKRAREILDELRRRSGEFARPQDERDYIERLLNSF